MRVQEGRIPPSVHQRDEPGAGCARGPPLHLVGQEAGEYPLLTLPRQAGPAADDVGVTVPAPGAPQGGAVVERLVRAILASSPRAHVFVAHDSRQVAAPAVDHPRVHVRSHGLRTDWGSWELVQATLDAFAWAREVADPSMVTLISGQDYPAVPLAEWEQHFLARGGRASRVRSGWRWTARCWTTCWR